MSPNTFELSASADGGSGGDTPETSPAAVPVLALETEPHPGLAPCPHCFESSGYVWEHGNDWNSGPWSNQTNIRCSMCDGTGSVESEPVTLEDLEEMAALEEDLRP